MSPFAATKTRDGSKPTFFRVDSIAPPWEVGAEAARPSDEPPRNSRHDDLRVLAASVAGRAARRPDPDLLMLRGCVLLDQALLQPPAVPEDLVGIVPVLRATSTLPPLPPSRITEPVGARERDATATNATRLMVACIAMTLAVVGALALTRGPNGAQAAAILPSAGASPSREAGAAASASVVDVCRHEPEAPAVRVDQRPVERRAPVVAVRPLPAKVEPPMPAPAAPTRKPTAPAPRSAPAPKAPAGECDLACLMQRAVAAEK